MDSQDKKTMNSTFTKIMGGWVPRKVVKDFFDYGDTKMSTFADDYNIRVSKVGKRTFYKYADLVRLIDESATKDSC